MKILITGVSCIGKSTIGNLLSQSLKYNFFDFDLEVEKFYNISIERIKKECFNEYGYREKAAIVLKNIFISHKENIVIAMPPSGLKDNYLRVLKKQNNLIYIVLQDKPENILERITFYDIDSKQIFKKLSEKEKKLYLKEIRKEITYYKKSYLRANYIIDISGCNPSQSVNKIINCIGENLIDK